MIEMINKVSRTSQELARESGRQPTAEEIADEMGLPLERVKKAMETATRKYTLSLEAPVGSSDSQLGELIEDKEITSPEEAAMESSMAKETQKILATLTPREEKILRRRFGIGAEETHTLAQLGEELGVTRERVRQIEAKALSKLRRTRKARGLDYFKG